MSFNSSLLETRGGRALKNAGTFRLAVLLFATLGSLLAQQSTRMVEGVVTDRHSHPLAHVAVQIENNGTSQIRSYITKQRHRSRAYRPSSIRTTIPMGK